MTKTVDLDEVTEATSELLAVVSAGVAEALFAVAGVMQTGLGIAAALRQLEHEEDEPTSMWMTGIPFPPRFLSQIDADFVQKTGVIAAALADSFEQKEKPELGCVAAEMICHHVLLEAEAQAELYERRDVMQVADELDEALFEDHDFLMLWDPGLDGIEGDATQTEQMGLANLHYTEWLKPFREGVRVPFLCRYDGHALAIQESGPREEIKPEEAWAVGDRLRDRNPQVLLKIPNHHVSYPVISIDNEEVDPSLPPRPSDDSFVAYMTNEHGEQLVFIQEKGLPMATLYHGDNGWTPTPVKWAPQEDALGIGDVLLDPAERKFARAAWEASYLLRKGTPPCSMTE